MVATVTNKQSIYVYSLQEMRTKFLKRQQRLDKQEKANINLVKAHQDPLALDTEQSHDAHMPLPSLRELQDENDEIQEDEEQDDPNDVQKLKPVA